MLPRGTRADGPGQRRLYGIKGVSPLIFVRRTQPVHYMGFVAALGRRYGLPEGGMESWPGSIPTTTRIRGGGPGRWAATDPPARRPSPENKTHPRNGATLARTGTLGPTLDRLG